MLYDKIYCQLSEKWWNSSPLLACAVREGHAVCIRYRSLIQNYFPGAQSPSFMQNALDAFEMQ